MLRTAILLLGLAGLAFGAALPASADPPKNGPPPEVGTTFVPTPRFTCIEPGVIELSFKDGSDFKTVSSQLKATTHISINGKALCGTVSFNKPVTVLGTEAIGAVVLPDKSEFAAYEMHGKFPDGQEVWSLWLHMTKDVPLINCDDCI